VIGTDELVDWYLLQHREWRQRDQGHTRTGWRASSLGYCMRKQTYARLGIPSYRDFDAQTLRTFSYGDMTHDWLKRIYRNAGLLVVEGGRLEDPSREVAGHFDVLLAGPPLDITDEQRERWSPAWTKHVEEMRTALASHLEAFDDEPVLGEIKSMSSRALQYARKEGPKDGHPLQIGAYFSMIRANPEQIAIVPETGRLIYVGKDSVGILEFELDESWIEAADDTLVIADGFSCKTQVAQLTDRRPLHVAQVIRMAMDHGPDGPPGERPEQLYPDVRRG